MLQCRDCKGTNFYQDSNGYHVCNDCGVQSQELFSESFESETYSGKIISKHGIKIVNKKEIPRELNIQDYLEVFQRMLMILTKVFVDITKDHALKQIVKKIWFDYLELWSSSSLNMLQYITSESMTSKLYHDSDQYQKNPGVEKELPVPSKPLLIGILYLALRIRKSWILPNDIIRWICDGKIPYITLYSLIPEKHLTQFRHFTHTHRIFNRDNLLTQYPLTSMNIIFHSVLLSQILNISYPSLNGPLQCYVMTLSLGLPYHIIWNIIVKLSHLYSMFAPLEQFRLFRLFYHENIAITVFTACQLSPCWLTTWSYEPFRPFVQQRQTTASDLMRREFSQYTQVIEEPPLVARLQRSLSSEVERNVLRSSFQTRPHFQKIVAPYKDRTYLPKSLSECDHLVSRANLVDALSHFQNSLRTIDRSTGLGEHDNSGFLSFNSSLSKIFEFITPTGQSLFETLLYNPSFSSNMSSHAGNPRYDNTLSSFGGTVLVGNPITYSYIPADESMAIRRSNAHVSLHHKTQKKKHKEFYQYVTYQGCNPEESIGCFHPPYQLLLERISKHMQFQCGYLYSLQSEVDQKFLQICLNIHQNRQRQSQAQQRLRRYELYQLSTSSPLTGQQITADNIEEYSTYCKYVFPMLQSFGELHELDSQVSSHSPPESQLKLELSDPDSEEETENEEDFDNLLLYSRNSNSSLNLRSNLKKNSSFRTLWDSQSIYETLNRVMTNNTLSNDPQSEVVNKGASDDVDDLQQMLDIIECSQPDTKRVTLVNGKRKKRNTKKLKDGGIPVAPTPLVDGTMNSFADHYYFSETLMNQFSSDGEADLENPSSPKATRTESRLKQTLSINRIKSEKSDGTDSDEEESIPLPAPKKRRELSKFIIQEVFPSKSKRKKTSHTKYEEFKDEEISEYSTLPESFLKEIKDYAEL